MASNLNLEVILSLVDKLSGPMKQATGSLDALGKEARQAGDELARPVWTEHERTVGSISEGAEKWGAALGGVASAAEDVESTLRRPAWVEHGRSVVKAAEAAHSYRKAMGGAGAAISAIPVAPIKEQAAEIKKATGNVNEHTAAVEKGVGKTNAHAEAVGALSGAWEQAKQIGVATIGGATGLKLAHEMIKGGAERAHTDVAMTTAGLTPAESAEFDAAALRLTAKYPTLSQTGIKDTLTRLRAQTGSAEHALMAIDPMLGGKAALQPEYPEAAQSFDQIGVGLEVAGAFTEGPKKLTKYLDRIVRSVQVNKGTIRPEDYKLYYQHLGSGYAQKLDDDFQYGPLSLLLNEMGGDMAATGQKAFEREVYNSTVTGRRADQLKKIGMLPDESKIHYGKKGNIKYLDPGALRNWQLGLSNPDRWINEELGPRIEASGLPGEDKDLLFRSLWQTDVASNFATLLKNQRARSLRDTDLEKKAPGLAAALTWLRNDPGTAWQAATTQGGNILSGAGMAFMPSLTGDARAAGGAMSWWNQLTAGHEAVNAVGLSGVAAGGMALAAQALKDMGPKAFVGRVASGAAGIGGAYLFKELLDAVDPGGNFWGLTTPIDTYFKKKFGWTPANIFEAGAPPEGAAYDPALDPNSKRNVEAARQSLYGAGYMAWRRGSGYQDTGELGREEDRESRRGWAMSPGAKADVGQAFEAARPTVDTGGLDQAQQKAKETGEAMKASLEQPIAPKIETSSLERAAALLREMSSLIGIINGGVSTMHAVPAGLMPVRGAALHDGPETR